ncbi:hypothetical protein NDU88_001506 [Pleurodeles waltl]|uniref:Uncharacterized protein n=1 Tax=Pleurodeles waltl TaxID=8319 RepID=A0AAV7RCU1_PLEWA|nr:hypothetical protein NDU88_001506 [Pleurodeles waltl]
MQTETHSSSGERLEPYSSRNTPVTPLACHFCKRSCDAVCSREPPGQHCVTGYFRLTPPACLQCAGFQACFYDTQMFSELELASLCSS